MKNFIFVQSVIVDMLEDAGLKPPSRVTLQNWRKGRMAKNTTKTGIKQYPVPPKLILNEDYVEKPGKRTTVKYSQSGYDKILDYTRKLKQNSN